VAEQVATHISRDPSIYGGKPCIEGRRVAVHDVASRWRQRHPAELIAAEFSLTLGEVHAALSYYFDHQETIDREMEEEEADIRRRAAADTSPVAERIRRAAAQRRTDTAIG
jgi:uncharacterized protein (DUF433 family)